VKKLVLFALIALGVSCATARHTSRRSNMPAVASAASVVTPKAADNELSPEDILRLLSSAADADPVPTPKCDTPFCVTYVRINGPIMNGSTKSVLEAIKAAKPTDILMLDINTPGGSVGEGFELEKALEATPAKIYCVVDGDAYSMGFFMLQSCQNRIMTKRSSLMAHEPLMMTSADEMITIHDLGERINDLTADARGIAEHAISRMKITLEQYQEKTTNREWFMAWPEALQVGAVDCVYAGTGASARKELGATGQLTCQK